MKIWSRRESLLKHSDWGKKKEIKLFLFTDDTVLNRVNPNIHVTKTHTHTKNIRTNECV